MSSFGERFLFFSTQPRNPIVIKRILKVVKKYNLDGKQYTKELQKEFYKDYTIESPNKGGNSKNKELEMKLNVKRLKLLNKVINF